MTVQEKGLPTVESLKKVSIGAGVVYGGIITVLVAFSVLGVLESVPLVSKILEICGLWFLFQNKADVLRLAKQTPAYFSELLETEYGQKALSLLQQSTSVKSEPLQSATLKVEPALSEVKVRTANTTSKEATNSGIAI